MIAQLSTLPAHIKGACLSGSVAGIAVTVSVATAVEALQGIAAVVAIVSGAYSFYLAFTHKGNGKKRKGRKKS